MLAPRTITIWFRSRGPGGRPVPSWGGAETTVVRDGRRRWGGGRRSRGWIFTSVSSPGPPSPLSTRRRDATLQPSRSREGTGPPHIAIWLTTKIVLCRRADSSSRHAETSPHPAPPSQKKVKEKSWYRSTSDPDDARVASAAYFVLNGGRVSGRWVVRLGKVFLFAKYMWSGSASCRGNGFVTGVPSRGTVDVIRSYANIRDIVDLF